MSDVYSCCMITVHDGGGLWEETVLLSGCFGVQ